MESSPVATEFEELENGSSTLVGLEEAGGDCIAGLLSEAEGETSGDETGELETPCEEDPTSVLLADALGRETP